jgi:hypothetical protein
MESSDKNSVEVSPILIQDTQRSESFSPSSGGGLGALKQTLE